MKIKWNQCAHKWLAMTLWTVNATQKRDAKQKIAEKESRHCRHAGTPARVHTFCIFFSFILFLCINTYELRVFMETKKIYDKTLKITQKLTQQRKQIMCSARSRKTLVGRHTHTRYTIIILSSHIFCFFLFAFGISEGKNGASCLPFYNFVFVFVLWQWKNFHWALHLNLIFVSTFFSRRLCDQYQWHIYFINRHCRICWTRIKKKKNTWIQTPFSYIYIISVSRQYI